MNPEVKAKWVEALRSRNYRQQRGALRRFNSFCCLGVLCDLAAQNGVGEWNDEAFGEQRYLLPESVRDWAGIDDAEGPLVMIGGDKRQLSAHNDSGHTFSVIADAIESQL